MDEASSPMDERKDAEPTIPSDNLQQQDSTTLSQQQQQQQIDASQQSSSSSSSTIGVATNQATNQATTTSNTATATNNKNDLSSMPEDLLSNKRWGTTPIRQDTPWDLPPSPMQTTNSNAPSISSAVAGVGSLNASSLAIPPGISQSNQAMAATVGLVGASSGTSAPNASRFDQPWRPMAAIGSGFQTQGDFARAPGPATSSILDAKPFGGIGQRASTWSSFGSAPTSNDPDTDWPKTTNSGISLGQAPSNAFDLVHDFDSAKPWNTGGGLMKSAIDDDSPLSNLGNASMSAAFSNPYGFSSSGGASKSPNGGRYEAPGIGTWSPIVKSGRSGSMWEGEGADGRGDNGRFDDGTAIWGNPTSTKVTGAEWGFEGGDTNSANDKTRSSGMNNQSSYRPSQQQSSSSASLLVSTNTSPSGQHGRNPNVMMNKASSSSNFDQVQQQANALSNQANQPNRGLGLSPNVPSKHQQQLTTMVQQIQLAVQAGHLNPQILNQPLAPATLQLLYQLLTQIRSLHQLQMKFSQPGNHQAAFSVQMTKTKQNIMNLQNQIAAQQAMHLKQQQQAQAHNISARQPMIPNLATGGVGSGNLGPALPPGISQSGSSSVSDFHSSQAIGNSFGVDSISANGLASSLSHMSLGGNGQTGMMHSSRFDQPWRASASSKPHHPGMSSASSSFANHNLMNAAPGGMQKSMLGGSSFGIQQSGGGEFARAPGPASSMMDNNLTSKPTFGMTSTSSSRTSSTWSAFGNSSSNDAESEWPKSTTTSSGISSGNTTANQSTSNAFDLVPEFEPGKPWRGSMLMRSVEDDPTMTPASMARSLAPQRKIWSDDIL